MGTTKGNYRINGIHQGQGLLDPFWSVTSHVRHWTEEPQGPVLISILLTSYNNKLYLIVHCQENLAILSLPGCFTH